MWDNLFQSFVDHRLGVISQVGSLQQLVDEAETSVIY